MKLRLTIRSLILILLLPLLFTGCSSEQPTKQEERNEKPVIAVTIVPEETFVRAVAGDLVEVVTMVPPGANHETYEPSPMEMDRFSHASIYFTIGLSIEETSILPNVGDVKVVSLKQEAASVYPMRTFPSGGEDPHLWLSPKRVKVMISAISHELSQLDPDHASIFEENAGKYLDELDDADQKIQETLAPLATKKFIVYHPAFGYFADDYGLAMFALEEEGKEATPKHLQEMVDIARAEGIKAIFYQEEIDSRQSASFAEEIGGKAVELSPMAADYIANLLTMADQMAEVMR